MLKYFDKNKLIPLNDKMFNGALIWNLDSNRKVFRGYSLIILAVRNSHRIKSCPIFSCQAFPLFSVYRNCKLT